MSLCLAFKLFLSSKLLLCLVLKVILEQYVIWYCTLYLQNIGATIQLLRNPASGISTREYKRQSQHKFKFKYFFKNRS